MKLLLLLIWLSGLGGHPAPAPVYVPGPHNKFAPSPSCATVPTKSKPTRFYAACKTTQGLVVRGPFGSQKRAEQVADQVYETVLAQQGGQLRP